MTAAPVLDFERLLAPIPGDAPAGMDLRADPSPSSLYFKIKDARSAARAAERELDAAGLAEDGGLLAPWRLILDLSPQVLAEQTKDLEIAAWLTEALVRGAGIAGLRDGFRLMAGLVETFWDGLYPLPDEDGIATRVAPVTGLNGGDSDGTLIQPIRKLPISQGSDPGPYALWQYEQAIDLLKLDPDKIAARVAAGSTTVELIQASVRQTPASFYTALLEELETCLAEYGKLGAALDARCGREAPPSSNIRNALRALQDAVRDVARDLLAVSSPDAAMPVPTGTAGNGAAVVAIGPALQQGPINSRDEAFRALLAVAEYFRKNEPQALVSYVIEEAVRRAKLPLPELVSELIPDAEARRLYFLTAGIRPPEG